MKVTWLPQASAQLDATLDYNSTEFGRRSAYRFLQKVKQTDQLLSQNPCLGKPEPLLAHRATAYRSIVVNTYSKIVYRVMDNRIEIADLWDTRREPKQQAEGIHTDT